jgi:hypothetical protein
MDKAKDTKKFTNFVNFGLNPEIPGRARNGAMTLEELSPSGTFLPGALT